LDGDAAAGGARADCAKTICGHSWASGAAGRARCRRGAGAGAHADNDADERAEDAGVEEA